MGERQRVPMPASTGAGPISISTDAPNSSRAPIPALKSTAARTWSFQYCPEVTIPGGTTLPKTFDTNAIFGSEKLAMLATMPNIISIGSIKGEWNASETSSCFDLTPAAVSEAT